MKRPRQRLGLYGWLAVSLLIHSCLLALPGDFLETVFPARTGPSRAVATDLTPDFEGMAISIIPMPADTPPAPIESAETEEAAAVASSEVSGPTAPGRGSAPPGGYGDSNPQADTRFFPPIPRIIVPPALDDLDIPGLSVNIRILVGTDGTPLEIEIPESLADPEVRRRLLSSAARFRFEPARKGDLPVRSWISLPLQFEKSSAR